MHDIELTMLFCPTCSEDRLTEVPPCTEGHGEACPDRACLECGTALLLDGPLFALARPRRVPAHRRAAGS